MPLPGEEQEGVNRCVCVDGNGGSLLVAMVVVYAAGSGGGDWGWGLFSSFLSSLTV